MKTDIEIARSVTLQPISDVAAKLRLGSADLVPYGHTKAKLAAHAVKAAQARPEKGKLVLVTAVSPTPAGEGKTTVSVGLTDGLNHVGHQAMVCLREPSLGPCFGMKGGAAGGGRAQVLPMEEINLHFTGDFHAITSAHNLLAALIDNHIHWGNALGFDTRKVAWRRVVDMNDRALREVVVALGGSNNGYPRESGFDITVASEIMAIFCLATSLEDLQQRLGDIIVGYNQTGAAIHARDLEADGAMTVLLKDAFMPNLVQTMEHNPAMIHGGPFANIAHGCNSVVATQTALGLADYVVTEAGFGADLGAEKFFDIKCRQAGLHPDAVVLVATVRSLKMHGGVAKDDLKIENLAALERGMVNLDRHLRNLQKFGVPVLVAINHFVFDTEAETALLLRLIAQRGVEAYVCTHWAEGGAGAVQLAEAVVTAIEAPQSGSGFQLLYADELPLIDKIAKVATELYGASGVQAAPAILAQLQQWEQMGFGHLPVCIAKTQYSFSADASLLGAPSGHELPIREVRLAAGAGFVVVVCGNIMTMPGLPRLPAANQIHLDTKGQIEGLF
ncbi:MAG: formate--tetrahydrofolate ligase [Neisseriaceae bacterium]|nr:formate--tetrahydrofolate ligase [Neisseriaceae bacterium]